MRIITPSLGVPALVLGKLSENEFMSGQILTGSIRGVTFNSPKGDMPDIGDEIQEMEDSVGYLLREITKIGVFGSNLT